MHKYLYIDDTFDKLEEGTVNGIQATGEIEVNHKPPGVWEDKIIELIKILPEYSGLIVDLRLNDKPYEGSKKAQYRGSTVAQEIRTLVKEKKIIRDLPVFLISADQKLEESLDKTSLDLFDNVISKNTLGDNENGITYKEFIVMLKSFAEGYLFIQENRKIEEVLGLKDCNVLDSRFVKEYESLIEFPNHVLIRFVNKQFLSKSSVLVNENVLAARLGIKMESEDWPKFKDENFSSYKYSGILAPYYELWWWPMIENWWNEKIDSEQNIRSLTAPQRVSMLKKKLGNFNLSSAIKSAKSESDKFWTVCKATKIPIDTVDGFLITGQDNLYSWQEKQYISYDEALRPKNLEVWKNVATVELNKLTRLKEFYENTSKRIRR